MNIALIGDSHSEVLGPVLSAALNASGHRAWYTANRGWSTRRYIQSGLVPSLIVDPQSGASADRVVVLLGGNDMTPDRATYANELKAMVDMARARGAEVVWVGSYRVKNAGDVRTRHERSRQWQGEILPAMGVTWIDGYPASTGVPHAADGLHFPRSSYVRIADALLPRIGASQLSSDRRLNALAFVIPAASLAIAGAIFYFTVNLPAAGRRGYA